MTVEGLGNQGISVQFICKKLAIVHGFIHNLARKQVKNGTIFVLIEVYI